MLNNQSVKYTARTDSLSLVFMALADPTRRTILELLSRGDLTVNDLASHFTMSLPAVSKHLKVLERAGLVSRGRNAQWRPVRLETQTLKEGAEYMNRYRELWEASLIKLGSYVEKLKQDNNRRKRP